MSKRKKRKKKKTDTDSKLIYEEGTFYANLLVQLSDLVATLVFILRPRVRRLILIRGVMNQFNVKFALIYRDSCTQRRKCRNENKYKRLKNRIKMSTIISLLILNELA